MKERKIPKLIHWLNWTGAVILMVGLIVAIGYAQNQKWLQFEFWVAVTLVGWFMSAIRIPLVYPAKLFAFEWYDFIPIVFPSLIILIVIGDVKNIRWLVVQMLGLWAAIAVGMILMRVAARIGARIAGGSLLDE